MKILSFDAETNGLWGQPYAIAAVVYECVPTVYGDARNHFGPQPKWQKVAEFTLQCSVIPVNEFVSKNMEQIKDIPFASSYEELLSKFAEFYNTHNTSETKFIVHMGYIVESFLIRELYNHGFIGEWSGPYSETLAPWHDVSQDLEKAGLNPARIDEYIANNNLMKINAHNPLYDCEAALLTYLHLNKMVNNTQKPPANAWRFGF